MQEGTLSDSQLIEALVNRQKPALALLYDRYASAIYGIILRVVKEQAVAEDALQDCFMKVWNKIESFDPEKGRLFTWISNIARNTAIDFTRSRTYKKRGEPQSLEKENINNPILQETTYIDGIGLQEIVGRLKPEYKELVDLLYFRGYSHTEAAETLNLPLGTVKTRARTAIQELRKLT
ncbi:MAG: sigma-70 family RNA polymerase sigma factor [Bacteroidia bacterium]|nr:sigma-70 family RNA polymerase sigma factor [Bacteroidia bacterium]